MKIVKSIGLKISNMQRCQSYIQLISQIITILLFIVICCACSKESDLEPTLINVTSITLSQTSVTLSAGESVSLTATITPENTTNKTITWYSSNTSVATVSAGKITAVAVGKATITAQIGNVKQSCSVTINPKGTVDMGLSVLWSRHAIGFYDPSDYSYIIGDNYKWDVAITTTIEEGGRIPTVAEWQELIDNCKWEVKVHVYYGYSAVKYMYCATSKINGNSLYFPLDEHYKSSGYGKNHKAYLWSSSLDDTTSDKVFVMYFYADQPSNIIPSIEYHCHKITSIKRNSNAYIRPVYSR